jgi:predicted ATPase/DNA-binding CsgD family transcriptional regulator
MVLTNLPVQLTSFVGREREIADVKRLLFSSHLVTLTGAGGSGKTRLAIQIANSMKKSSPDGACLVDLAPLHESALVPQVVAQVLGLQSVADHPWMETLLDYARSKQLLIILDNCEHLTEACAQLTQELLSQAPELRVLATSREPLSISGELIYPISGLSWPSDDERLEANPQDLMQYDAVCLFVERARAISPDFNLTHENALPTVEICRRLDGLPLALELAGARVNVLTVDEIRARLNDRFSLLISTQQKGLEQRHRTLRAAIDWSFSMLTADEQILLRRLAVFPSGFTLDMAEGVCCGEGRGERQTLDQIASLVSKSLLVADTLGRAQARYRLLETIREYALEKLEEAGETAHLHNRHLDLFLAHAEEAEPKLNDAYQQLWLNWLENEHDNIRAALAWALESGAIEEGLRIACDIVRFWEIRGYLQEGLSWFERLLSQATETVSPIVRANAFSRAAFLAMFLDDAANTIAYGKQAVTAAESAGEAGNEVLIVALGAFSSGARVSQDFQTAYKIGERMIKLLRESPGQPFVLCMTLITMGSVAIELGQYNISQEFLDEGLTLAQADGDPFRIAMTLNILGDLARSQQKYAEALAHYERSAASLRELNAQRDLASVLCNLGFACLHLGSIERAHTLFRESMEIQQTQQNFVGVAECLLGFAAIATRQDLPAAGARLLGASTAAAGKRVTVATVWRATRMEYKQTLELARVGLSESGFQEEQAIGQAMSVEQAIHFAFSLPDKTQPTPSIEKVVSLLTSRELEVAGLIGQGKSNREIAEELFLSKRTVETHASHILSKLGLSSRAQIMRWVLDHGLTKDSPL